MIEGCADPEAVARDLGAEMVEIAGVLVDGAKVRGPIGVASLGMLGRILGASWSGPRVEAAGRAARNSEMLNRLEAALAGQKAPDGHVAVTVAAPAAAKLPWDKGFPG